MRNRVRAGVRRLRATRFIGAGVRGVDRIWWARVINRSSLVDAEFYAAQLGVRRLPRAAAIAHYVTRGFRRGMSLNPLFDDLIAGAELPEVLRVPALYAYLVSERETVQVHPWWDAVAFGVRLGGAGLEYAWSHPDLTLELTVGARSLRLTTPEVRALALTAARTWRRHRAPTGVERSRAALAVVRPVQAHDRRYARKLVQAASLADDARVVVSLVGVDAAQWISAHLMAAIAPELDLRAHRSRATWSAVVADALRGVPADTAVILDARSDYGDDEILALAAAAEGAAVMPAHRAQDGTVLGLGAADIGGRSAWGILQDHPVEDLDELDPVIDVPLLHGRALAAPLAALRHALETAPASSATDVSRHLPSSIPRRVLSTIRPVLEEPQLAYAAARGRAPRRDGDRHRATQIVERAGFDVVSWSEGGSTVVPRLRWRRPHAGAQRWAIKICAPAGRQGAVWGDAHFARGLSAALRRRGHQVVIDAFDARLRPTGYLDDVSVAVRGPYRIDPPETGVRLQWIISHPDEMTRDELSQFDQVFAASVSWSREASRRWGISVEPLLECTDTDLFHPRGIARTDEIVFVGTARGIPRPSVVAPLEAGIPVRVYGPDWRPFIAQSAIAARSIAHDRLPERYESASVVLNDQWPAMREHGFMAMRPFDVVAVGGRVISEEVEGIDTVFGDAVVTYRDPGHLVELLRSDPDTIFPDDETLGRASERIRREHSFDARALVLDEAVRRVVSADSRGAADVPG